jgi:hypothetical protein
MPNVLSSGFKVKFSSQKISQRFGQGKKICKENPDPSRSELNCRTRTRYLFYSFSFVVVMIRSTVFRISDGLKGFWMRSTAPAWSISDFIFEST